MNQAVELGASTVFPTDKVQGLRLGTLASPNTANLELLISGDFGAGKPHLLQLIKHFMAARPDIRIHYLNVEGNARTDLDLWKNLLKEPEEIISSSTEHTKSRNDLYKTIENLFAAARGQDFEDGMQSEFSKEVVSLIDQSGVAALEVMASLIMHEKINAEVAAEALRALSRIEDTRTYNFRLWLLLRSLQCVSTRVRDAAVLGLAYLDDTNAVSAIKQAIESEQCLELRKDMEQVLSQLITQCRLF